MMTFKSAIFEAFKIEQRAFIYLKLNCYRNLHEQTAEINEMNCKSFAQMPLLHLKQQKS